MQEYLTPNFSLDELTKSESAARFGIQNIPSPQVKQNMKAVAQQMEKVRLFLNAPIVVNSMYRSPELNRKIGGSVTSSHVEGWAIDFISPRFGSPEKIARFLVAKFKEAGIKFDQIIMEGTWVHLSFAPKLRGQVLQATFKNGKASYSAFN